MRLKYLFFVFTIALSSLSINAQELNRIAPVKVKASSFHKDPTIKIAYQNREYAEFYRDNSPEKAVDGEKKSVWMPLEESIDEWIELEFPYPIDVSQIKVLSGCHITDRCFSGNKKIKKFELSNEHGEREKLTIKKPEDFTGYKIDFKKPTRTLRFKILSITDETSRNAGSTVGFAEIVVGHQTFDSEPLQLALASGDLNKVKKAIKSAKKVVSNPHAITVGGENPLEWATRERNEPMANMLWESGFRFGGTKNTLLAKIITKPQLDAHFVEMNRLHAAIEALAVKLNDEAQPIGWQELDQIDESLYEAYATVPETQKKTIRSLVKKRRPDAAKRSLEIKIDLVAKEPSPSLETLEVLRTFATENRQQYKVLSDIGTAEIESLRRSALTTIFQKLTENEKAKINNLPNKVTSIPNVYSLRRKFNRTYSKYSTYQEYKEINELFKEKKTTLVAGNAAALKRYIGGKTTPEEMDKFRSNYLSNVNITAPIADLRNFVRDRKKALIAEATALENKKKREAYERAKAERDALFAKAMANSKKTILDIEWRLVTSETEHDRKNKTVYYSAEEMDVLGLLNSYLNNLNRNSVYIYNQARSKSAKILIGKNEGREMVFSTSQEIDSHFNINTGQVYYNSKPEISRVVNSAAWRLAQRCSSVKNYMNTPIRFKFRIVGVTLHKSTGLPVVWHTKITESVCAQKAAYDNCALPCNKRLKVGSDNFYFIVSDYVERWNSN